MKSGADTTQGFVRRLEFARVRVRGVLLIALAALLVMGVGACDILESATRPPQTISVLVRNYCLGPNSTVRVFINDVDRGTVYWERTFPGIRAGLVRLRAVGTGSRGSVFTRNVTTYQNGIWVLCPPSGGGGGSLGLDVEGDDGILHDNEFLYEEVD